MIRPSSSFLLPALLLCGWALTYQRGCVYYQELHEHKNVKEARSEEVMAWGVGAMLVAVWYYMRGAENRVRPRA
jgi:hypothetical protein